MRFRKICIAAALALMMGVLAGCDASAPAVEESASQSPSSSPAATETMEATPSPEATESVATQSAGAQATDEPATMPEETTMPDQTVSFLGNITNVNTEEDVVTVAEEWLAEGESDSQETADPASAIDCLLNEDTILIDAVNGTKAEKSDLKGGMRAFAFVSPNMTRSLPPQSNCFALILNVSDDGTGAASYVKAMEVSTAENGNLVVLNQNADLYVTIPADLTIDTLDGGEASLSDIEAGSVIIAWYDVVAESYPAQTTATKVVLCPTPEAQPGASADATASAEAS